MCHRLDEVVSSARAVLASLDASSLGGSDAAATFRSFAELENLAAAGKLLVAPKVAGSDAWARDGQRSAVEWMAKTSGSSIGQAKAVVETASRVEKLPATADALRSGGLSLPQVAAVSEAALAAPERESELLGVAGKESVRTLQDKSRRVVLDSRGSLDERYARQRKLRAFSTWVDDEGMTAGRFRLTPDAGAAVINKIGREADRIYRRACRAGRKEDPKNYAADAFAALVTGEGLIGTKSRAKGSEVVVLVSRDSLLRGEVDRDSDEICEVPGFGAIPVSRAKAIMANCFLKAVVYDGTRITHVKHFGRHRPAELDTALLARSVLEDGQVICKVEGCDHTARIQWDHAEPFARGNPTSEANLNPMCGFHNRAKEQGRVVKKPDGNWVGTGVAADPRSPPWDQRRPGANTGRGAGPRAGGTP